MAKQTEKTTRTTTSAFIWKRFFLNRWLLISVAALAIYSLTGFFLLPWLVSRYTSRFAENNLKRKASIEKVHMNPFLFKFEAIGFNFQEADGRPIIGFQRLLIDFELSSIFKWAWTFAEIQIEKPVLNVEIEKDGHLNLEKISDTLPKSESPIPAPEPSSPRLIVLHAQMMDGTFHFSDQSALTPVTKTFESLDLEFKDISTLPEQKGPYIVQARLPDGGTIAWQGELSFQPMFSEGEISITGFKVATAWEFAQDQLNLEKPTGQLDITSQYRFDYQDSIAKLVLKSTSLSLNGLSLAEKGSPAPMLSLAAVNIDDVSFDSEKRELLIPDIRIQNGKIVTSVDEKGTLNWQNLFVQKNSETPPPPDDTKPIPDSWPWVLNINGISIQDLALEHTDRSRVKPLALVVGGIKVSLKVSAEGGNGPVKAAIDGLGVKLNEITLSEIGEETPVVALDGIILADGQIDIDSRTIKLARIEAAGGTTHIVRNKNGQFPLFEFLATRRPENINPDMKSPDLKTKSADTTWAFGLGALELNNHHVNLQVEDFSAPLIYDLKDFRFAVKNISNDGKTPMDFEAAFNVAQGGNANLSGNLSQSAEDITANIKISGISLMPLRPLLSEFTTLNLESGNISTSSRLIYHAQKTGPQISADGKLDIDGLKLSETETGERFLEWKALSANNIKLGLSPDRLQIEEVKLIEPGAKIMIYKDHSVNLAKIVKTPEKSESETAPPSEPLPAKEPQENRSGFPVGIERIRIKNGVVDFSDLSLVIPFATHVTDFSGAASGISTDPASQTSLTFEGKVGDFGLSSVKGSLKPFSPKVSTDISVLFQNVAMTPLSPYSATFAGRKIASGNLNLNLEYKIQNSELLGHNAVVLEDFTLGERVESPGAISLPLDLAIALLTDTEGKIDIALPVRGNVDNPEFRYGTVIRKAIINLITKIVTSPFRALGGLFGDKEEKMDAIAFQPGSVQIQPSELKKLQKVAEALKKRPQLKLVVQGQFDSKMDGEALRKLHANRAIVEQMEETKLSPDEEPEMISFDKAKTQRALEKRLEIVSGEKAVDDFKAAYEEKTGRKPKPVKPYLAVFGKESSDVDYYRALFEELVKLEPLDDAELTNLGNQRAAAIVKALTASEGLDNTRAMAGTSGPAEKASQGFVNTKLTLDVIKSGS